MSVASGRCLCGAVRFTADDVRPEYWVCHCGMCVRWSAGPFLSVSTTAVSFEGEENVLVYDSSARAERASCRQCGSILYYRMKKGRRYAMSIGLFEDASKFRMAGEIFVDRKPADYEFAGEHPRLTEAETIARFSADGDLQ